MARKEWRVTKKQGGTKEKHGGKIPRMHRDQRGEKKKTISTMENEESVKEGGYLWGDLRRRRKANKSSSQIENPKAEKSEFGYSRKTKGGGIKNKRNWGGSPGPRTDARHRSGKEREADRKFSCPIQNISNSVCKEDEGEEEEREAENGNQLVGLGKSSRGPEKIRRGKSTGKRVPEPMSRPEHKKGLHP